MRSVIEFIDMDREELNQLVERAGAALSTEEHRKLKGVVEALSYLTDLVADQQTTIHDLHELLFPASTQKTEAVLKKAGIEGTSKPADNQGAHKPGGKQKAARPWTKRSRGLSQPPPTHRATHESETWRSMSGLPQG